MNRLLMLSPPGDIFDAFKNAVIAHGPDVVTAVAIFLAGLLLAHIARKLVDRLIRKLEAIPNRALRGQISPERLERSARLVANIVYWTIIVLFLAVATETLGLPIVTTWLSALAQYLPNIIIAAVIVYAGIYGGALFRQIISAAAAGAGMVQSSIIGKIAQYTILILSILVAIDQIGIEIALLSNLINIVLAAMLFGAALAFALGARTSVSNILASYYAQSLYREGQTIRIDGTEGRIVQFTATAIILETADGLVSVPAKAVNENVTTLIKRDEDS